jgi:dipeptidyl-peptidase 4
LRLPTAEPTADGLATPLSLVIEDTAEGGTMRVIAGVMPLLMALLLTGSPSAGQPATTAPDGDAEAPAQVDVQTAVGEAGTADADQPLTARMLTAPNALMGPVPSSLSWSPVGARLAYVYPRDGHDALWLYDADAGTSEVLLDPPASADRSIDPVTAAWSPDGAAMLLAGEHTLWLLDVASGALRALLEGGGPWTGLMFLPDGAHISFVEDNDLFRVRVADGQVQRLTWDGSDTVINGGLDWVYGEELATRTAQPAHAWSPDGRRLIWLRTDDSGVQEHPVTDFRPVPPTVTTTRYPVAGSANPHVSLHVLSMDEDDATQAVPLPADAEYVLPSFAWSPDGREAFFATVDRGHSTLRLMAWDPEREAARELLTETDAHWINEDRYAAPVFLADGERFLWLSERDGFMHLYLYDRRGNLLQQLTHGEWMIDSIAWNLLMPGRPVQVDPAGEWAYFVSTRNGPLERQVDRVAIETGDLESIPGAPGWHAAALSGDGRYLVDQYSDVETPPVTRVLGSGGGEESVLAHADGPVEALPALVREFVTVTAHDGVELYAQLVKPEGFDPSRTYPVVVHWYGGPGLQTVSNRYGRTNIFNIIERDVLYTQAGFLVWRLDNRGSPGRGHGFETPIAGRLGPAALDDQLAGIEYLLTLPYVDASRIGTDGKSFGGYMTLYALIHAPDVFHCGVAGAAPTDWRLYDTIYTERFMGMPQENPAGYAETDLIAAADRLQARPLLIHGLADRNVHLQNSVNFIEALMAADKPYEFVPLPNLDHGFTGDGLVTALNASVSYLASCLAGVE